MLPELVCHVLSNSIVAFLEREEEDRLKDVIPSKYVGSNVSRSERLRRRRGNIFFKDGERGGAAFYRS